MHTSAAPIPRRLKADNIIRMMAKQIEMCRKHKVQGSLVFTLTQEAADLFVEAAKELGE